MPTDILEEIDETLDRETPRHIEPRRDEPGDRTPPYPGDPDDRAPQYVISSISTLANVEKPIVRDAVSLMINRGASAKEVSDEMGISLGKAEDIASAMKRLDVDPGEWREEFREWRDRGVIKTDDRVDREERLEEILETLLTSSVESNDDLRQFGKMIQEIAMIGERHERATRFGRVLFEGMVRSLAEALEDSNELQEGEGDPESAPAISEQIDVDVGGDEEDPVKSDLARDPFDTYGDVTEYLELRPDDDAVEIVEYYGAALKDIQEGADNISGQLEKGDMKFVWDRDSQGDAAVATLSGQTESGRALRLKVDLETEDTPYIVFSVLENDSNVAMRLFESNWMATIPLLLQHSMKALQVPGYNYSELEAEAPEYAA